MALARGTRIKENEVARILAARMGKPKLAEWYEALRSAEAEELRNPAYDRYLARYRDTIGMFYPDIYSQAELERIGVIEEEEDRLEFRRPEFKPLKPIGAR